MSLPPVEKLSLAVRKNVRDEWEAKKGDRAAELTEILGEDWAIEVDLLQLFAYTEDGSYSKENFGHCVNEYFSSGISRLKEFISSRDDETKDEVNAICHAKILTLDADVDSRWSYNGCDVVDGRLRILFNTKNMGTNIYDALRAEALLDALNAGDAAIGEAATGLSFKARQAKRAEYDPKVEEVRKAIAEVLGRDDVKLTPNLEDTYAKLKADVEGNKNTSLDKRYWEEQIAPWTLKYFDGLLSQLKWQNFHDDDMLQEGFNEAVESGEIAFRVLDALKEKSYCEFEIEGGVFYLQTQPKTWGTNLSDAATGIIDKL